MITNHQADVLRKRIRKLIEKTDDAAFAGSYPPVEANQMRIQKEYAEAAVEAYIKFLSKS